VKGFVVPIYCYTRNRMHSPIVKIMSLGLTQPLVEKNAGNITVRKAQLTCNADNLSSLRRLSTKCATDVSEHYGPPWHVHFLLLCFTLLLLPNNKTVPPYATLTSCS
jgi:hypothetical protein